MTIKKPDREPDFVVPENDKVFKTQVWVDEQIAHSGHTFGIKIENRILKCADGVNPSDPRVQEAYKDWLKTKPDTLQDTILDVFTRSTSDEDVILEAFSDTE